MDAVKYLKEFKRMCDSLNNEGTCRCGWCEFPKSGIDCTEPDDPAEAVRIVEEWSKAHPMQTRRDKFKEVFGVEPHNCHGMMLDTPLKATFCSQCEYESGGICKLDAHAWWDAPYEVPKGE